MTTIIDIPLLTYTVRPNIFEYNEMNQTLTIPVQRTTLFQDFYGDPDIIGIEEIIPFIRTDFSLVVKGKTNIVLDHRRNCSCDDLIRFTLRNILDCIFGSVDKLAFVELIKLQYDTEINQLITFWKALE